MTTMLNDSNTVLHDLQAITPTSTARAAFEGYGANLDEALALLETKLLECRRLMTQILSFHPNTGSDTTNYATLTNLRDTIA